MTPRELSALDGSMAVLTGAAGAGLRVNVSREDHADRFDSATRAWIDECWSRALEASPGLFDAPVFSVERVDPGAGIIECRRARYRELVAQTALTGERGPWCLGVAQLSVTGLLVGRDARGNCHVAIGRRSEKTRIYPRMWELAPAGGVEIAEAGTGGGLEVLTRALDAEAREELGMELDMSEATAVALSPDPSAGSVDVIIRVDVPGVTIPHRAPACGSCMWEYTDTAWLSERDAMKFVREHEHAVIPPTRAALARLGELVR
jgi:hypothetical protein